MTTINGPIGPEPLKKPEENSQTAQAEKAGQPNSVFDSDAAKKVKELAAQDGNETEVSLEEAGQKTIFDKLKEVSVNLRDTAKNTVMSILDHVANLKYIVQPKMTEDEANAVLNKIKETTTAMTEALTNALASVAEAGRPNENLLTAEEEPKTDETQTE